MKKRKISKWRIKRGINFHDEMLKYKYSCYSAPVAEIGMNTFGFRGLDLLSNHL